ncbi:MAG: type IV secretory system conjugative DNA transfer family protein [Patescibacteria group bacterium]
MPEINSQIAVFAETNFRNERRRFGIKVDDRRRHMYFVGKTGMGKSVVLENLIYHDIISGNGVAVVDPHGDLAEKVIEFIPANRINDVIYFNPADIDFPIAFNVLEKVDPKYRHLVASGLIGVFKKIWADSWGPRLEYLLRNAILALLDYPDSTLLGVNRILVDKEYRKKVVAKIQDPVVKAFWLDEFTKYNQQFLVEAIAPIQNKVGQFLSTSLIRNIVGQVKSTISMRDIMDNRKILILNLSKGRIGEDSSSLLGAMIITKIQLAAMSRVDIPESERKDFYLYVDEFQNFATESFAGILSEARKYRLNLTIAHQYIEQLGDVVKAAVFGNVGTIICFRVGAADAEELEKEFTPRFTPEDLVNLPKYNIYLKLMIDGVASDPFSANTLPPRHENTGNVDKIVTISRERYAKSREVVEEKIARWSGVETEAMLLREEKKLKEMKAGEKQIESGDVFKKSIDFLDILRRKIMPPKELAKAEQEIADVKEQIEAEPQETKADVEKIVKCDWCSARTRINFEPDPEKPVLCKECLKDYRRMQAKGIEPPKKLKGTPQKMLSASRPERPRPADRRPKNQSVISINEALSKKPVAFSRRRSESGSRSARPVISGPKQAVGLSSLLNKTKFEKKINNDDIELQSGEEVKL